MNLSIQEQYDKMIQERDALHQEVMELEKAEPLQSAAQKLLATFEGKSDPLLHPNDNEWVQAGPSPTGC